MEVRCFNCTLLHFVKLLSLSFLFSSPSLYLSKDIRVIIWLLDGELRYFFGLYSFEIGIKTIGEVFDLLDVSKIYKLISIAKRSFEIIHKVLDAFSRTVLCFISFDSGRTGVNSFLSDKSLHYIINRLQS